jgi:hypothetical protein
MAPPGTSRREDVREGATSAPDLATAGRGVHDGRPRGLAFGSSAVVGCRCCLRQPRAQFNRILALVCEHDADLGMRDLIALGRDV